MFLQKMLPLGHVHKMRGRTMWKSKSGGTHISPPGRACNRKQNAGRAGRNKRGEWRLEQVQRADTPRVLQPCPKAQLKAGVSYQTSTVGFTSCLLCKGKGLGDSHLACQSCPGLSAYAKGICSFVHFQCSLPCLLVGHRGGGNFEEALSEGPGPGWDPGDLAPFSSQLYPRRCVPPIIPGAHVMSWV